MPKTARDRLAHLADKLGKSQNETRLIIDAFLDDLVDHLGADGHVSIPGFGILRTVTRAARSGFNPFDGTRIEIPQSLRVTFQAAKKTRERLGLGPVGPIVKQRPASGSKKSAGSSKKSAAGSKKPSRIRVVK